MDCPRCGAHNESEVGSCLSCGAAMTDENLPTIAQKPSGPAAAAAKVSSPRLGQGAPPKQCPNCMTLNAATFKFCARCGTPLGAIAGAPPPKVAGWPAAKPDAKPAAPAGKPTPAAGKPAAAAAPPGPVPKKPAPPPPPKPRPG